MRTAIARKVNTTTRTRTAARRNRSRDDSQSTTQSGQAGIPPYLALRSNRTPAPTPAAPTPAASDASLIQSPADLTETASSKPMPVSVQTGQSNEAAEQQENPVVSQVLENTASPAQAGGGAVVSNPPDTQGSATGAGVTAGAPTSEGGPAVAPPAVASDQAAASEATTPELAPEQAVAPAAAAVGRRARGSASHQTAGMAAGNAVAAGNQTEVTQRRAAQQQGIQVADSAETSEVNQDSFEQALRNAIAQAMPEPRNETEVRDVMQHGAERASAALSSTMGQQQEQAAGTLPATLDEQAQPDPAGMPGGDAIPLVPEPTGDAPASVSSTSIVPPPSSASSIDTSANRERVDTVAAENNITTQQLRRGNEPRFEQTLGAREEAEQHDREAPQALRAAEAEDQQATRENAQGEIARGLSRFHASRVEQLGSVATQQGSTQGLTEQRKQQITTDIEAIGAAVRSEVTQILDAMDTEVNDTFEAAIEEAMALYEDAFEDVKGGVLTSISDWWNDVSNEERLQMAFAEGRRVYDQRISTAITIVARTVEEKLRQARDRVATGRTEIDRYMAQEVSDAERNFAEQAATTISDQFDTLEGDINSRRDALVERMVGLYRDGIERRNAREEVLREENKSFWERVYDATVGVIAQVIEFKNMLLGILARAAAVVEAIIQDPIGFLSNLIAGIGAGLERFVANIGENLKQALMGWLFGALEGAGIRLPETFDLKGFLDIVLQVLGLTKDNVRARAVRLLGEETVSKIEGAVDFIRVLFTEGPAGIWQMLLEKLGNIKDVIIEEIKSFVITKIIVAGVKWLVGLLNPAAAFVKACMAIYDIVMFFIQRGQQIISAVNAIINALGTIVAGNIGAMAEAVEGALNRILPVVIGFLASLLGLGGISDKIRLVIDKIQAPVNRAIDWVINKGVSIARRIGSLFGGGREEAEHQGDNVDEEETDDPEKEMKIAAAFNDLYQAETSMGSEDGVSREDAEMISESVVREHDVIKSMRVEQGNNNWVYFFTASPEQSRAGHEEIEVDGIQFLIFRGPSGQVRVSVPEDEAEVSLNERASSSRKIQDLMNGLEIDAWIAEKIVSTLPASDLDMAYNLLLQFSRQEGDLPPDEYIIRNLERNVATSAAVSRPPGRQNRARLVNLGEEEQGGPPREPLSEYALVFKGQRGQWESRPHPPTNSIEYIYHGAGMALVTALGAIRVNDNGEVVEILSVSSNVTGGERKLIGWMRSAGWTVLL